MRFFLMIIIFCSVSRVAYGQVDLQKLDIHLGYSRDISKYHGMKITGVADAEQAGNNMDKSFNGFQLSATYPISTLLGLKLEVANHFSTGTIQAGVMTGQAGGNTKHKRGTILGGIQIKKELTTLRIIPFGHLLAGLHRQNIKINQNNEQIDRIYGSNKINSSGLAAGLGAGIDVKLNEKFDIRAFQVNYIINFIGEKQLSSSSAPYTVKIEKQQQKQITIGLGIVYHL